MQRFTRRSIEIAVHCVIILLISSCRLSWSLALSSAPRSLSFLGRALGSRGIGQTNSMNTPKKKIRSSSRLYTAKKITIAKEAIQTTAALVTPAKKKTAGKATPTLQSASAVNVKETPRPVKRRRVVTPQIEKQEIGNEISRKQPKTILLDNVPDSEFDDLDVAPKELRPSTTLTTGQCFHWKAISRNSSKTSAWGNHNDTEWIGCLRVPYSTTSSSSQSESVVVVIRETPTTTLYRVLHAPSAELDRDFDIKLFLRDYFQLDEPLAPLYREWSQKDSTRLGRIAQCIPGVRILNQDPWECLASFICSSNNNIPRITQILQSMRFEYGRHLVTVKIATDDAVEKQEEEKIYSFPSLQELQQQATDADLRKKCGMGYRAKFILETMELLQSFGGESYLQGIKEGAANGLLGPTEVQDKLVQFCGVGQKVADCVALFSLKQADAIPVDTHVWNIACRDYDDEGQLKLVKSLTPKIYRQVGDLFRDRFENKAGWAHSLLFVAELPSFRPVLPEDMVDEMDRFRAEEQARKKSGKK